MGYLLVRGVFLTTILMLGFILGIIYSNHVSLEPEQFFLEKGQGEASDEKTPKVKKAYQGFILKEAEDFKIKMEDGERLVIYNHDDEEILDDLVTEADYKRDITSKQLQRNQSGNNIFSDMGLKTADVFEGTFKKLFSLVGN